MGPGGTLRSGHQTRMCGRGAPLWVVLSLLLWRVSYCGYADRWGYCLAQFATSPLVRGARTQHHCLCSSGSLRLVLACRWIGPGPSELAACLVGGGWGQGRCQTTSGQDRVPTVVGYAALTRRGAGDGCSCQLLGEWAPGANRPEGRLQNAVCYH